MLKEELVQLDPERLAGEIVWCTTSLAQHWARDWRARILMPRLSHSTLARQGRGLAHTSKEKNWRCAARQSSPET